MFADRVCFVDVETTGASPVRARVTEIGVVAVESEGDETRVEEWSSLVNPGAPIPRDIQWLTGITDEMVRAAPSFGDIAAALAERLHGAILVAHNARFDYGFLRAEFARCGVRFRAPTLCTVRLSRLLDPDRGTHSLDAIAARYALDVSARHRALGDARLLWQFVQRLVERHGRAEVQAAAARLLARPVTPAWLAPEALDEVPPVPGVYMFYGLNAHPIYIGKSVDLRARVASHFSADRVSETDARLAQETRRLEWEETAGEIGALLREAELVKTRLPAHNVALRRRAATVFVRLDADGRPRWLKADDGALDHWPHLHGPFSSRAAARRRLIEVAAEHGLCLKAMALERGARGDAPCFNFQLRRCRGCCVGHESATEHAARLLHALAACKAPDWPFAGAIAIVERNPLRSREDWHVFDRWCWLGTVRTFEAAAALAREAARRFDADAYRIARLALQRAAQGTLQAVPLP